MTIKNPSYYVRAAVERIDTALDTIELLASEAEADGAPEAVFAITDAYERIFAISTELERLADDMDQAETSTAVGQLLEGKP